MPESRIRILDEDVASKIAAGEVVERPASVVKELVENAVDAGATRITVEVRDGGKALIRVADNGCGMTAQEAVLALQRHATSKIRSADDLAEIRTLGFRGEALPSIASVSRLSLTTRARGEMEGVRLTAEAGEIRELEPAGAAEGTVLTIEDLFYNTPARLKFLKTTRTELGQICDALTRLALSRPGVTARLIADGEEMLHAPGSADPLNTITALYGKDVARDLIPVSLARAGLAVEGYVSRPTFTRATRSGQHFFVNGRWVRSRTLIHALDEAYRSTMHVGRFPFAVLHVEIDPAQVDVNVHPTKAEVRFLRDWEVHRAVHEAVRQAIGAPASAVASEPLAHQATLSPEALRHGPWLPPLAASPAGEADPFGGPDPGGIPASARPTPSQQPVIPELQPAADPEALQPIAQLWESFILAAGRNGLVIVDQHLAHERVLFEKLLAAERAESAVGQVLTAPITLQLTFREAASVNDILAELARVGFLLEPFGKDAFVIRAAPAYVPPGQELGTLRQLLEELAEARRTGAHQRRSSITDFVAATAACRAAIKKGSRLAMEEMRALLVDLSRSSDSHTCPHGCPISVEVTYQELLKRFKRI